MSSSLLSRRACAVRCLMGVALLTQTPLLANASEFPPVVELSELDGVIGFQINGEAASDNTGGSTAPEFEIVLKGLKSKIGKITAKDFKL
jgi:hypothetical protein